MFTDSYHCNFCSYVTSRFESIYDHISGLKGTCANATPNYNGKLGRKGSLTRAIFDYILEEGSVTRHDINIKFRDKYSPVQLTTAIRNSQNRGNIDRKVIGNTRFYFVRYDA